MIYQGVVKVLPDHCYGIPGGCYSIARLLLWYPRWMQRCCQAVAVLSQVVAKVLQAYLYDGDLRSRAASIIYKCNHSG